MQTCSSKSEALKVFKSYCDAAGFSSQGWDANLLEEGDFWFVSLRQEPGRPLLTGSGSYLIDVQTAEVQHLSSGADISTSLRVIRDNRLADGKHWVLKTSFEGRDHKATLQLRKWCGLSIADARKLTRYSEPFLTGQRWNLETLERRFIGFGFNTEILLVDEIPRPVIELPPSRFELGLGDIVDEIRTLVSRLPDA